MHDAHDLDIIETLTRLVYRRPPPVEDATEEAYFRSIMTSLEQHVREARKELGHHVSCALWKDSPSGRFFGAPGADLRESPERVTLIVKGRQIDFCNERCCVSWLAPRCGMEFVPHETVGDRTS